MIHGDLTPSNFFLNSSSEIVLIDFGLSFISDRREDRADDLHLLKTVLTAEFASRGQGYFAKIVDGYASVTENREMNLLTNQIKSIERRGRYARVD
jgi:TP53 regulating kinase-like protein